MKKLIVCLMLIALVAGCAFAFVGCGSKTKIGVQSGTTGEYYVKGDADWGFDGLANTTAKGFDNGGLAVQAMLNGQVDYVIIDEAPAKMLAQSASFKGKVKVIEVPLTEEEYGYAISKTDSTLLAQVNTFIAKIKANGTYDTILNKYFGNGAAIEGIASATKDLSKADKQLVVATNASFAPFEYKIGDKYAGVDMEIAKLLADELNMELVIEDMEFASVVTSIGKNGVDIGMSGMTINDERKKTVNFSDSYYNAAQVLIVKADDTSFDGCKTAAAVEALLTK